MLALGDSSYELFCNAGTLLDECLEALGVTRLIDRVDVDGYYQQPAKAWTTDLVKLLSAEQTAAAVAPAGYENLCAAPNTGERRGARQRAHQEPPLPARRGLGSVSAVDSAVTALPTRTSAPPAQAQRQISPLRKLIPIDSVTDRP